MSVMHYWVNTKVGYVMSSTTTCPVKSEKYKMKYIGFTEDIGWPKRMNTGRVFYKQNVESERKQRKYRKKLYRN